ncbi:MAG: FCD domain-containing protein [Actinobacteria bacterium]|nr:FCD domain-containing protein [Actinomycetota bacterium]
MSGQLRSGEPLNIDALARDLQTSATPVREGLLVLQGQGFVQMEPRHGFRITPLTRQDIADMFLVQSLIAGELAARAAREASESLLGELTSCQESMRQADARSDGEEMEALNFQFHRLINRAVPSPKLTWLISVTARYVPRLFYASISGWRDASLHDHETIIESLRTQDPEGARQAMISHILHAGELLVSHLENEGFWSTPTEV